MYKGRAMEIRQKKNGRTIGPEKPKQRSLEKKQREKMEDAKSD